MAPHTSSGRGPGGGGGVSPQNTCESVPSAFEMFSGMGPILITVDQQQNKILLKGTNKWTLSQIMGS